MDFDGVKKYAMQGVEILKLNKKAIENIAKDQNATNYAFLFVALVGEIEGQRRSRGGRGFGFSVKPGWKHSSRSTGCRGRTGVSRNASAMARVSFCFDANFLMSRV